MLIHFPPFSSCLRLESPPFPPEYSATGSMTRSSLFSPSCSVSLRVGASRPPARPPARPPVAISSRVQIPSFSIENHHMLPSMFSLSFSTTCNHSLLLSKALIPPPLSLLLVYSKNYGPSFASPHRHSLRRYPNLPHAAARCDHTDSKLASCK